MNPICPYCRTEVGEAEGDRKDCPGCGTPHHADCFTENGGCTVFGCANAPSDEAKVTVTGTDLMGNVVTRQAPAPVIRPGLSLGAGYTTFHAPVLGTGQAAPQVASGGAAQLPPPPPPLIGGTGVAPPPQATAQVRAQAGPESQIQQAPSSLAHYYPVPRAKTRVIFVLLGIFLGVFGAHNFYAGYVRKGTIQLCLTLLTLFYGAIASWIWAIVEICVINQDADGTQFV